MLQTVRVFLWSLLLEVLDIVILRQVAWKHGFFKGSTNVIRTIVFMLVDLHVIT